jgi:thymidylate kinase
MIHQSDISQAPDDGSNTAQTSSPWIVVTGLDGAGKTTLVGRLESSYAASRFRLPYHDFVRPCLARSGAGEPFGDVQTDRLLFSLDARLANYQIRDWRREGRTLVSQRGWMDNFIFGAVQGLSYRKSDEMLQSLELERPSAQIFLVGDPAIAFERIRNDPDKYETADFLVIQYAETLRFFDELLRNHPDLKSFADIPTILIDTSIKTPEQVYDVALDFLVRTGVDRI